MIFTTLSLPIIHRYRLDSSRLTPYTIVGITPSIGGPSGLSDVGYGRFVTGFELDAVIGAGFWYGGMSVELRGHLPMVDPFERPINPSEFRSHPFVSLVVGF